MERILTTLKRYWILLTVVALVIIVTGAYFAGLRIGDGGIVRVGTLYIENLPDDAEVYVDQSLAGVGSSAARLDLTPGAHQLIVSANGAHPWNELVTIESDVEVHITPLLIPTRLSAIEATGAEALQALAATRLPSLATPLMPETCVNLSVSGNRVVGTVREGCTPPPYLCTSEEECLPIVIFDSVEPIRDVILFPGRNDALILSTGTLLYALEIDPREPRFFAPLGKATGIRVAPWTESSVLIRKDGGIYELLLTP